MNFVLGTMTFGESVFPPEIKEFIQIFLDHGNIELDTAYVYNEGKCEKLLGEALRDFDREKFKISTKINPRISGKLDREAAFTQLNGSLERLCVENVDTLYLHFPDPNTPVEDVLEACSELYNEGKFKELGLSNFPAWMVSDIWNKCDKNGWIKPSVYQGIYNPLTRKAEVELNDALDNYKMRFYAFNPMAGGLLTGKYVNYDEEPVVGRFNNRPNYKGRYWKKSFFEAVKQLDDVTKKYNISLVDAVYRWLAFNSMLNDERGDAIIIGASKIQHLKQNLSAIDNGPLPKEVCDTFEEAWNITKADSPEYFRYYKKNSR